MSKDKQLVVEPGSDRKWWHSNFGSLIRPPLPFQYRIISFNPYNRWPRHPLNWRENTRLTKGQGDIIWIWASATSSQEALALSSWYLPGGWTNAGSGLKSHSRYERCRDLSWPSLVRTMQARAMRSNGRLQPTWVYREILKESNKCISLLSTWGS